MLKLRAGKPSRSRHYPKGYERWIGPVIILLAVVVLFVIVVIGVVLAGGI